MPAPCPPTPRSEAHAELGFVRRRPVRWFTPTELARAGLRAGFADLFGSYADKREVQAALHPDPPQPEFDYGAEEEFWIDYVADLGDGFDATFTIARLLAEPALSLDGRATRRGRILVMGGDEVYPVATRREYEDRMAGPYRAALPWLPEGETPDLYALPGNHDWYDGLTAFLRQFTQGRWIGAWRTRQSRSYFALRLPHGWWLYGIDTQLQSDIDDPQRRYFLDAASKLAAGDRVIVCTAEPSWLDAERGAGYRNLAYFMERIVRAHGGAAVLALSGDLHHYARYVETPEARAMLVTSGGGGAFLHGTHDLPREIQLEREPWNAASAAASDGGQTSYRLASAFPDAHRSRWLAGRIWRFPVVNWKFCLILGAFFTLLAWVAAASSAARDRTFIAALADASLGLVTANSASIGPAATPLVGPFLIELSASPALALLTAAFAAGCVLACKAKRTSTRILLGVAHAIAQIAGWLAVVTGLAMAAGELAARSGVASDVLVWAGMPLAASAVGGVVFALYLALASQLFGCHGDDVFSALGYEDWKGFLRLHIDRAGRLTVHPVGVRRVAHHWKIDPGAKDGAPWFESAAFRDGKMARLIEAPLAFDPARGTWRQDG